ncbi:protein YgfX [Denitratisoma oestradiolicum]|uniref:Toxin CptA n=1 Tax=Denitratisoma oestradiolicum TaxID=311182 RepID=A0A6S6XTP2_9PROT|nr:protein YgfX [Denitratisoma oestradiolicum]TWO80280.1 hypothetical protein CBW56_10740 [Denitratisoma oestradiolicum]CAB1369375.1 conserved protein of unknown function [Denitratisoma oestradiolicum]
MQLPITIALRPSASLTAVLLLGHGLALAAVFPCDLPLAGKGLLILLLVLSSFHAVARHAWHRDGPASLILRRDGRMELAWADDSNLELEVVPPTTVHAWLIVLRLRTGRQQRNLVLPPDALGVDNHRKLRVWLCWKAGNTQA